MVTENSNDHDGIDLFGLFETLWSGKWTIIVLLILAMLAGFGYAKTALPKYKVSIPFSVYNLSVANLHTCRGRVDCLESMSTKRLISLLGDGWIKEKKISSLILTTMEPAEISEYEEQMERAGELLTNEYYTEATRMVTFVETDLSPHLLRTEVVASSYLTAKTIIQKIESDQSVVTFGSVSVAKTSPRLLHLIMLSAILGGMAGILFVLVRDMVKTRIVKPGS